MTWLALEPPISMFAPPDVGGAPRRVPLICVTCQEAKECKSEIWHLHVAQRNAIAVGACSVYGGSMTCSICHGTINDQRRSGRIRWITSRTNLLARRGEENWSGDDVLLTGTKAESIA
jgi:hypothetical protein